MKTESDKQRDRMFLKLFLKTANSEVTDEEVAYFRDHPDQIDEVTAPVAVHKLFLWAGALLGTLFGAHRGRGHGVHLGHIAQSTAKQRG